MSNNSFGFEELEIWKKARLLKIEISATVRFFPADERYLQGKTLLLRRFQFLIVVPSSKFLILQNQMNC